MQVLQYFDYIFTGIFTIEISIKVNCNDTIIYAVLQKNLLDIQNSFNAESI